MGLWEFSRRVLPVFGASKRVFILVLVSGLWKKFLEKDPSTQTGKNLEALG